MRTKVPTALFCLVAIASSVAQPKAPTPNLARQFRVNQNRPYVYLQFDHVGKGNPFSEEEPSRRVWFRLVNNCRVPIVVRTFGVPDGYPDNEAGLFHDIVRNPESTTSGVVTVLPRPVGSKIDEILHPAPERPIEPHGLNSPQVEPMPNGYDGDVSSTDTIPPGKALLFSVPVTHLNKHWHMEIPYKFELPRVRGLREPLVGGEPKMVLLYSASDLPSDIQEQLEVK